MLPLLSFHALVAHRGDGLRPELLALPNLRCLPRMSASNPRQSRRAREPDSSRTIQPPINVGPPERQFILMMWRSDLSNHPCAGRESTDRTTQGMPITSPSIHQFE